MTLERNSMKECFDSKNLPERTGYGDPREYPRGLIEGTLVGIAFLVLAYISVRLYLLPVGTEIARLWVTSFGFIPSVALGVVVGGITIKLQTELHEWTHYIVRKLHGKDPEFDNMSILSRGNPNVQIPGQWATRGENILVLLAPLLVVDAMALFLIVIDVSPLITFLSALGFVINTGSAGNDILGAIDDFRYQKGTLIYYSEDFPKGFIYEPEGELANENQTKLR